MNQAKNSRNFTKSLINIKEVFWNKYLKRPVGSVGCSDGFKTEGCGFDSGECHFFFIFFSNLENRCLNVKIIINHIIEASTYIFVQNTMNFTQKYCSDRGGFLFTKNGSLPFKPILNKNTS